MIVTIGSIVFASIYFAVAWTTNRVSIGFDRSERVLWTAIPITLALLGINKLFEGALTSAGRLVAFDQGWYAHRRVFQIWLVGSVLAVCSIGAIVLLLFGKASEPFYSGCFVSDDHVAGARSDEGRVAPSNRSSDRRARRWPEVKLAS